MLEHFQNYSTFRHLSYQTRDDVNLKPAYGTAVPNFPSGGTAVEE
jgi:hypothetical protein